VVEHRYWDTCAFLGFLKQEPDKIVQCRAGIQQAQEGKLVIITSTLTLAETLYLIKGERPISSETREKVRKFFENDFILFAELDRRIGELAQDVVWDHQISPKDAVHVATALAVGERIPIKQLDTFDDPLIESAKSIDGIKVGRPNFQIDLFTSAELQPSAVALPSSQSPAQPAS
jgi:predicted nucleic acid-binding protein